MFTKIGIIGLVGASAVGLGTGAVASSSTSGSDHPRLAIAKHLLKNAAHGQIVTKGKDGTFVTHDLIHGTVSAVSASSITVVADDKVSQTYTVTSSTKVRDRATRSAASISAVHKGDQVYVLGTGDTKLTAKRIIEVG